MAEDHGLQPGENFGILYATHIPSLGFQRFSVAHELGHYFLAGHVDQLLELGPHVSRAGFVTSDPYEMEVRFARPWRWASSPNG